MYKSIPTQIVPFWENSFSLYDMKNLRDKLENAFSQVANTPWITLELASSGGDCDAGYALADWIESQAYPNFQTIGYGQVSSMAVIIFLTGSHRVVGRNTIMYLHEPARNHSQSEKESITQATRNIQSLTEYHEKYIRFILEHIPEIDEATLREWIRDEHVLNAKEMLKYGFAHEIVP